MPKLDVGVGDEFPTEEIIRDENGVVHHHHYYRRRPRRPFGFVRFLLGLFLIMLVLRLFRYSDWMDFDLPWVPHGIFPMASTLVMIAVVVGLICLLRNRDWDRPW
jgi:hypothetical protein